MNDSQAALSYGLPLRLMLFRSTPLAWRTLHAASARTRPSKWSAILARALEIFRNFDIDFRHFSVEPGQSRQETPADLSNPHLRGALQTGSPASEACFQR